MLSVKELLQKIDFKTIYAVVCYIAIAFITVMHVGVLVESKHLAQHVMNLASVFACIGYALFAITLPKDSLGLIGLVFAALTSLIWI